MQRDDHRYRLLVEQASDIVFTLDLDGNFTSVNPAGERLSGFTREETLALNLADVVAPEYLGLAREMLQRKVMGEVESTRYPLAIFTKDGRRVELDVSTWLVHPDGEQAEIQGIARDVAERERLLAGEQAARAEAEAALQARDQFLSSAAHELRTPLATIVAYVDLLRSVVTGHSHPDEARGLDVIRRQSLRLRRLVDELVEVSRLNLGRLELFRRRFELGELAYNIVRDMQSTSPKHRLVLEREAPVWAEADGYRIEQVLLNLLSNAIKHSPEGSEVTVRIDIHDGKALVAVRDEGIGIPIEHQDRLFERFYRAHTDEAAGVQGIGLGLFISREFIERHGGRIWCQSAEGKGSTFAFSLPLASESSP